MLSIVFIFTWVLFFLYCIAPNFAFNVSFLLFLSIFGLIAICAKENLKIKSKKEIPTKETLKYFTFGIFLSVLALFNLLSLCMSYKLRSSFSRFIEATNEYLKSVKSIILLPFILASLTLVFFYYWSETLINYFSYKTPQIEKAYPFSQFQWNLHEK